MKEIAGLALWYKFVKSRDKSKLESLIAEDAVFIHQLFGRLKKAKK